ncbi:MAG: triosephosphate isomerase [Streptosporangiaceae bacterium]|nr:triosephosphate isomerase [Streptosporangiaceae bacterium]
MLTIGISLKMYFGQRRTVDWCRAVAGLAARHPAVASGAVELFVLPAAPMIAPVLGIFAGTPVHVGAQNLSSEDSGAFTGEVSGALLQEMGCRYAEVNHAERRRLFGEDDSTAAAKVAACWRNGLIPVLCVGEPAEASEILGNTRNPVILAYEPHWAIGQAEPAPVQHIRMVTSGLRRWLSTRNNGRVIYGGSAGPGLLTSISDSADGLFLGRFAHDPAALAAILDEAEAVTCLSV